MVQPFRHRLEAMVAQLRAHPRIEVYELVIRPPAAKGDLSAAEDAIGMPLPADLRDFYRAHDGIFLLWGLRGEDYDDRPPAFGYPEYGAPPGCINLVPVREAMSPHWRDEYHVNEIQPDHQELLFGAPLDPPPRVDAVCVDNYSKYHHGDLILGPEPVMVVSTDHGADMDSSDFCTFSVYLDLVLAKYGTCRYTEGLGIGWSRSPQRVSAWTRKRSLDDVVIALEGDDDGDDEGDGDDDA